MVRSLRSRPTGSPLVEYVQPRRVRKAPAAAAKKSKVEDAPAPAPAEVAAPAPTKTPSHAPSPQPPTEALARTPHTPSSPSSPLDTHEPEDDFMATPTQATYNKQQSQSQSQLTTAAQSPASLRHSPFANSALRSVSPSLIDTVKISPVNISPYGQGEKRPFERMSLSAPDEVEPCEERPAKRSRVEGTFDRIKTPPSAQSVSTTYTYIQQETASRNASFSTHQTLQPESSTNQSVGKYHQYTEEEPSNFQSHGIRNNHIDESPTPISRPIGQLSTEEEPSAFQSNGIRNNYIAESPTPFSRRTVTSKHIEEQADDNNSDSDSPDDEPIIPYGIFATPASHISRPVTKSRLVTSIETDVSTYTEPVSTTALTMSLPPKLSPPEPTAFKRSYPDLRQMRPSLREASPIDENNAEDNYTPEQWAEFQKRDPAAANAKLREWTRGPSAKPRHIDPKVREQNSKIRTYLKARSALKAVMPNEDEFVKSLVRENASRNHSTKAKTSASRPSTESSITLPTLIFLATSSKEELQLTDPTAIDTLRTIAEWMMRDTNHKLPDTTEMVAFLDSRNSEIQSQPIRDELPAAQQDPADAQGLVTQNYHVSKTQHSEHNMSVSSDEELSTASDSDDDIIMPEIEMENEVSVDDAQPHIPEQTPSQKSGRWSTLSVLKNFVQSPMKIFGGRKESATKPGLTTNVPETDFTFRHEQQLTQTPITPSMRTRRSSGKNSLSERRPSHNTAAAPHVGGSESRVRKKIHLDPKKKVASGSTTRPHFAHTGSNNTAIGKGYRSSENPKPPIQERGLITEERKRELQEEKDCEDAAKAAEKNKPKLSGYRVYYDEPDYESSDEDEDEAEGAAAQNAFQPGECTTPSSQKRKRPASDGGKQRSSKRGRVLPAWAIAQGFTDDTFNWSGYFCVPDDSDSDSDSDSDAESTPPKSVPAAQPRRDVHPASQPSPPPKPRPGNAKLPQPAPRPVLQPSAAQLAQIDKYVPKTPSRLRQVSRVSSSPLEGTPEGPNKENAWSPMDVVRPSILGTVPNKHTYILPGELPLVHVADQQVLMDLKGL